MGMVKDGGGNVHTEEGQSGEHSVANVKGTTIKESNEYSTPVTDVK